MLSNDISIEFKPFTEQDIPLFNYWSSQPQVKNTWFVEGYHPVEYFTKKLSANGYDFPYVIYLNNEAIGYIQACDLYVYRTTVAKPTGVFTNEAPGTFCMDLFIGEAQYLDQGYGTQIVKAFVARLFADPIIQKIVIDPSVNNKRAIRCYEKAGFSFVRMAFDGITDVYVMEINKS